MTFRTKISIGIILLALIGGGVWFMYSGRSEITFSRVTPEQASKAVAVLSRDQDNDGLKDWEEELWHTDVLNPDTDGDTTTDGEEIKLGRNPTKEGPEDELDKGTIEQKIVPGGGDWTETDRLSRELFAKYLALKQSGQPFTAEEEQKLLEDFIQRYPEAKPSKVYTESELVFADEDTDVSLWAYGNAVGAVVIAHKEGGESELIIFERALENEDGIDLANLDDRIKRYEAMTDPVQTLSTATAYPAAVEKLVRAFTDISDYLVMKNILFAKGEAGYILTQ
ncbi:MAG: hypothetical protein UY50_C0023G0028 [Parcubacteria group bacterium GW2011_GWA2_49_9]|nr:MAG: hypothetical protein UY50_C0023G0028 [Parcubacteria group bacterium GW2011_GWA2_49_9]